MKKSTDQSKLSKANNPKPLDWKDPFFEVFLEQAKAMLPTNEFKRKDYTAYQKAQVENMIQGEKDFLRMIWERPDAKQIWEPIFKLVENHGAPIAARLFYRERAEFFKTDVGPALLSRNFEKLNTYLINYQFIRFVLKTSNIPQTDPLFAKAEQVRKLREELIIRNLMLAVSRARIFKSGKPQKHLRYMDLVQMCNEGLVIGIDKFTPPYTTVFRSTLIGRMVGLLIKDYSQTLLHFQPGDKRRIYRANLARKDPSLSMEEVTKMVNDQIPEQFKTNPSELNELLQAVSHCSLSTRTYDMGPEEDGEPGDKHAAPEDSQPDKKFEKEELHHVLHSKIKELSTFERKFLKMKGIV